MSNGSQRFRATWATLRNVPASPSLGSAPMAKLLVLLVIVGVAYWYWWGRPAEPIELREADRLRENAAIMQSCVKRERSMTAAGSVGDLWMLDTAMRMLKGCAPRRIISICAMAA